MDSQYQPPTEGIVNNKNTNTNKICERYTTALSAERNGSERNLSASNLNSLAFCLNPDPGKHSGRYLRAGIEFTRNVLGDAELPAFLTVS